MPRIRTIKPEFWDSPSTAEASHAARLLFIAMWNWADDWGVGSAHMKSLAAFAFPNDDDITAAELPTLAKEVADCFGVTFYEVAGRPYYAIPSWDEHQRTERRARRGNPPPPHDVPAGQRPVTEVPRLSDGSSEVEPRLGQTGHGPESVGVGNPAKSGDQGDLTEGMDVSAGQAAVTEDPSRNRGNADEGTGEQGNRGSKKPSTSAKLTDLDNDPDFTAFYDAYPRHVAKQAARKAWLSVLKKRVDPAEVITAAQALAKRHAELGTDPKFIPHPSTWLNEERWNDESEQPPQRTYSNADAWMYE